jgi:pyrroline-5-carboxylate reductase
MSGPVHLGDVGSPAPARASAIAAYGDPMGYELVIVGGGNMGAALLGGLLASGRYQPQQLAVVEIAPERREHLEAQFPGVAAVATVPDCRAAVIAVKPPDAPAAAAAAARAGAGRLLSIAAGVRVAALQDAAGPGVAVVRAMPNTPALVGRGASVITGGESIGEADLAWAEDVLGAVGTVDRLDEDHLDAITALTGSGPAYLFLVAESLIDAGERVGLPRELATRLTTQLFVGSSALLADRGDAARLREMVTSPGGTTAAGLRVLEDRGVRAAFADAVHAAAMRSGELG